MRNPLGNKNTPTISSIKPKKKRHWILLTLVVVVVIGVVWHWLATTGIFVSVDKTVEKSCMAEVKDKKFCKFAAHVKQMGDYKLTLSATSPDGKTSYVVSGSKDGNIQMVVNSDDKKVANLVVFNGTTFTENLADSSWLQYAPTAASKPDVFDLKKEIGKDGFKGDKGQKFIYKNLGKVTCDTMSCYKYQLIDTQNTATQTFLLFDDLQFLLRSLTTSDNSGTSEMTMSYEGVSIVQPAPVTQIVN